jgi:hypothetical protein
MGEWVMNGELAYKDIHGRVWHIQNHSAFTWLAHTLDIGHTVHYQKNDLRLEMLLASIDREGFTTDDRSTRPLDSAEIAQESRKSDPERIEEIRRNALQIDGHDSTDANPLKRFDERDE